MTARESLLMMMKKLRDGEGAGRLSDGGLEVMVDVLIDTILEEAGKKCHDPR